jgi:hypothetical protein
LFICFFIITNYGFCSSNHVSALHFCSPNHSKKFSVILRLDLVSSLAITLLIYVVRAINPLLYYQVNKSSINLINYFLNNIGCLKVQESIRHRRRESVDLELGPFIPRDLVAMRSMRYIDEDSSTSNSLSLCESVKFEFQTYAE